MEKPPGLLTQGLLNWENVVGLGLIADAALPVLPDGRSVTADYRIVQRVVPGGRRPPLGRAGSATMPLPGNKSDKARYLPTQWREQRIWVLDRSAGMSQLHVPIPHFDTLILVLLIMAPKVPVCRRD
jgi:hypothetical protein